MMEVWPDLNDVMLYSDVSVYSVLGIATIVLALSTLDVTPLPRLFYGGQHIGSRKF